VAAYFIASTKSLMASAKLFVDEANVSWLFIRPTELKKIVLQRHLRQFPFSLSLWYLLCHIRCIHCYWLWFCYLDNLIICLNIFIITSFCFYVSHKFNYISAYVKSRFRNVWCIVNYNNTTYVACLKLVRRYQSEVST
jgi:hypothetical protein